MDSRFPSSISLASDQAVTCRLLLALESAWPPNEDGLQRGGLGSVIDANAFQLEGLMANQDLGEAASRDTDKALAGSA